MPGVKLSPHLGSDNAIQSIRTQMLGLGFLPAGGERDARPDMLINARRLKTYFRWNYKEDFFLTKKYARDRPNKDGVDGTEVGGSPGDGMARYKPGTGAGSKGKIWFDGDDVNGVNGAKQNEWGTGRLDRPESAQRLNEKWIKKSGKDGEAVNAKMQAVWAGSYDKNPAQQ